MYYGEPIRLGASLACSSVEELYKKNADDETRVMIGDVDSTFLRLFGGRFVPAMASHTTYEHRVSGTQNARQTLESFKTESQGIAVVPWTPYAVMALHVPTQSKLRMKALKYAFFIEHEVEGTCVVEMSWEVFIWGKGWFVHAHRIENAPVMEGARLCIAAPVMSSSVLIAIRQ